MLGRSSNVTRLQGLVDYSAVSSTEHRSFLLYTSYTDGEITLYDVTQKRVRSFLNRVLLKVISDIFFHSNRLAHKGSKRTYGFL